MTSGERSKAESAVSCSSVGIEMNEAQMAVFGFQVFYFSAQKVFHKDWLVRGGTIGGRSLFRIFICMPL